MKKAKLNKPKKKITILALSAYRDYFGHSKTIYSIKNIPIAVIHKLK